MYERASTSFNRDEQTRDFINQCRALKPGQQLKTSVPLSLMKRKQQLLEAETQRDLHIRQQRQRLVEASQTTRKFY